MRLFFFGGKKYKGIKTFWYIFFGRGVGSWEGEGEGRGNVFFFFFLFF